MNRKLSVLLIAAVAAILPAVAIADVMITGQAIIESGINANAWTLQPGSNYVQAHDAGSITWTPTLGPDNMGQIDLQGMAFGDTWMTNVLNVKFGASPTDLGVGSSFNLYLNFSNSNFTTGAVMALSTYDITFAEFQAALPSVITYGLGDPPIAFDASATSGIILVELSQNPHILMTNFPADLWSHVNQYFYRMSFYLPAGDYAGMTATLTGQFVAV